ncbi:MAG: hypothetical protein JXM70_05905 [Pirellulales bacterium]|nr:hypothetical protein [Pirellulales bacterium]
MVIETPQYPFFEWLPLSLMSFLLVCGSLLAVALVFGYLVAALRHGPIRAFTITARAIADGMVDLVSISPRRVMALTWLSIKDSIRRRVVVVFGVFILIILFAGWFLDPGSTHPLRLYISFVLPATSYLVLALVLFLSVFSIPADLKSKTLHTVVTKPVHASEIVLGRMLGYIAVGTIILAVMGTISYVFVLRGLNHKHIVTQADLESVGTTQEAPDGDSEAPQSTGMQKGISGRDHGHRHEVRIKADGRGILERTHDHWHPIVRKTENGETTYEVGNPEGMLVARVPVYGKLRFVDRQRKAAEKGINVGDEWAYRSYIEGGSLAAAIWSFEGITPEAFPKQLPVEMTLGVFRSYKGDIEKGIPGSLLVRNPKTGLTVEAKIFRATEFETDIQNIPKEFTITPSNVYYLDAIKVSEAEKHANEEKDAKDEKNAQTAQADGEQEAGEQIASYKRREAGDDIKNKGKLDLFEDLVDGDRVEIWLQCLAPAQYYGAAQADLYLHAKDASFFLNFVKGYFGAWMQMVLVASFGVMFSTFLSGPIAMLATVGVLIGGFFRTSVIEVARGENYGGGPAESIIRIFTHQNVTSEANPGLQTDVAQMCDAVIQHCLGIAARLLPEFGQFSCADYLAYGFNISSTWISEHGLTVLAFFFVLFVLGSFILKTREVAR